MQKVSDRKRILWVDDEEWILSSVKRLFRQLPYEIVTEIDPLQALELIKSQNFSVLISDQRMPSMSGLELLDMAKQIQPDMTRIMVTGFIDHDLLVQATNRAAVMRFVTKPWEEAELLNDIQQAVLQSEAVTRQNDIKRDIALKTQQLTELTRGLNEKVEERTRHLVASQSDLQKREERMSSLLLFIRNCSQADSVESLMDVVRRELRRFNFWSSPVLAVPDSVNAGRIFYFNGKIFESKKVSELWSDVDSFRSEDKADQRYLADQIGRPFGPVVTFAFSRESWHGSLPPVLFFEKQANSEFNLKEFISERLQPIGLILNRLFLERRLEEASTQWEKTFDSIPDPVAIIKTDYSVIRGNHKFSKGGEGSNLCYEKLGGSHPCDGCPLNTEGHMVARKSVIKCGSRKYELSHYPVGKKSDANYFVHYYRDITEEQKIYSEAIQQQKMAALGSLAGNISHELNNPITGIQSLTQILLSDDAVPESVKSDLKEIEMAAVRSQRIIKDFKEFTVPSVASENIQTVAVSEVVKKTMPLLKTSLRHLHTEVKFQDRGAAVAVNPQLLQQVLFNLVINASQAMKEGGHLEIKTFDNKNDVYLSVKDTGPGIPQDVLNRIFEPFFTTKPLGKGTGLGLTLCRAIVEKSGGEITITSELGKGSEFIVRFPRAAQ